MHRIRSIRILLLTLLLAAPLFAQQAQPARQSDAGLLTLDTIFSYRPQALGWHQWQADGRGYLMLEPSAAGKGGMDITRYDATTGAKTVLVAADKLIPPGAASPLTIEEFTLSDNGQRLLIFANSQRVWRSNTRGDYWVVELANGKLHKLGGGNAKPSSLMFAKFSPDATRIGYVRENNLYVENLSDGRITPLTMDGTPHLVNGTFDWVYEEEFACRDGWRWSPDGQRIAYWQLDASGVKEFRMINNTDELYPKIITFPYPKAGELNSAARVGVVNANGGPTTWFTLPGDARNHYVPRMDWAAHSGEIVIQQLNRLQNTNVVWLGDAKTGKARAVLTEKDDTWVDVPWPSAGWDTRGLMQGDIEWIDGGKRFLWASERDGWRHIYSVARDGGDIKCITPGNYDLISVERADTVGGWLYFSASPDNATQEYLYRVRLDGGSAQPERLSLLNQAGTHSYDLAPRGDLAIHTYSNANTVPVTEIVRLSPHAAVRTLYDNRELQARLNQLKPVKQEFFKVDIGDGVQLDGWLLKPPDFDAAKRYPVLFHVYGEPWGQTVLDAWSGGQPLLTAMWHRMLAQQGYLVVSVDNRGTPAPRGRAWRKSIYRQMGIRNSLDQANAARAIAKWPFVDATRLGIWGWSGGGSSTLNALFRYPDVYQMGMSVAPVPDVRYYDSIYQERYCGLPQDHPDEYKQSSPLTFASQLQGNLLLVHGTGDDNVHYQGSEALINALIAANKQFTLMSYPNRSHSINEGTGTTRHLYGLLTRFLNEKLPAGGR